MAIESKNGTRHIKSIALKGISKRKTNIKPYVTPGANASTPVRAASDRVLYFLGRDDGEYVMFGVSRDVNGAISRQRQHNKDWSRGGWNFNQILALLWATEDDELYLKRHWEKYMDCDGKTELPRATKDVRDFLKNLRYNSFVAVDFDELAHLPRADPALWLPKKGETVRLPNIQLSLLETKTRSVWADVLEAEPTDDDFWTSESIIIAARNTMGSIDLDPASCRFANKNVGASTIFTQYDSGLLHDWFGNVWVNGPFSETTPFVEHAIRQLPKINKLCFFCTADAAGNVGTQKLMSFSSATCVVKRERKNRCWGPKATGGGPSHFIIYVGENPKKFCEEFSSIGYCSYTHGVQSAQSSVIDDVDVLALAM